MAELPKTGPELVRYYNERADEIGAKHVKRFATTVAGVTRCEKIDEEVRRKKESGDIVSSATEPVSAVSEEQSKDETTSSEDIDMSTSQVVSFEKQIDRVKKTPSKAIPKTIWKTGPRLKPGSRMSTLTEALFKKPMTVKDMSKRLYGKWSPNVRTILGGVRYVVKGGYVKAVWEVKENPDGEKTYRLLKK